MWYTARPPRCEAYPIPNAQAAAKLLGGVAVPAESGWAVQVPGPVTLTYSGAIGDYLIPGPWRTIPRAEFEDAWQPDTLAGDLNG